MLERARQYGAEDEDALGIEVPARTQSVAGIADWRSNTLTLAPAPKGSASSLIVMSACK